jgi:Flp pilus assembly protein TadB
MDRLLGEFVATIVGGVATIFAVAIAVLRRLRKRQLRRVNQQLDEILADSTIAKDGSFTKNL